MQWLSAQACTERYGAYCAEKIYRFGKANGRRVLLLEAGPLLVSERVQNLARIGLNVPGPIAPSADPGFLVGTPAGRAKSGQFPVNRRRLGRMWPSFMIGESSHWPPSAADTRSPVT
jgi:hypothetical protein